MSWWMPDTLNPRSARPPASPGRSGAGERKALPRAMWQVAFSSSRMSLNTRPLRPAGEVPSTRATSPRRAAPGSDQEHRSEARPRSVRITEITRPSSKRRRSPSIVAAPGRSGIGRWLAHALRDPVVRCVNTSSVGMFAIIGGPQVVSNRAGTMARGPSDQPSGRCPARGGGVCTNAPFTRPRGRRVDRVPSPSILGVVGVEGKVGVRTSRAHRRLRCRRSARRLRSSAAQTSVHLATASASHWSRRSAASCRGRRARDRCRRASRCADRPTGRCARHAARSAGDPTTRGVPERLRIAV